jgi:CRP-like cAMP-binding protein
MELVKQTADPADQLLMAGTASDHFALGWAHIWRGVRLSVGCLQSASAVHPKSNIYDGKKGFQVATQGEEENPLSDDYLPDDQVHLPKNGVFLPTRPWKESWDMLILVMIMYSAIMVPFRICFDAEAVGYMFIFEQCVTFVFITDVLFNFNTAYLDDTRWVISRPRIAVTYLQGWFWIDVPSSVPVELIDIFVEGDNDHLAMLRFLRLFRLLRLLRLLKVRLRLLRCLYLHSLHEHLIPRPTIPESAGVAYRFAQVGEYIAALEIKFDVNLTFLRIVQMLCSILFLAHMLGCFWFYLAVLVGLDQDETPTWVAVYAGGSGLDAPPHIQYLYSVYWALTTLTTVGYGDITPQNNLERMYSCLALLTGSLVFATMLASVNSLVAALDRQGAEAEEKLDQVKEYMRFRNLPRDLVVRMRRYYTYFYSHKTVFDESDILGNLTPSLRYEVVTYALKETIQCIPLFKALDPEFQAEVFPLLKPMSASPREIIFSRGDRPDGLFFLLKGQVDVISSFDGRVLYRVGPHRYFGESAITGRRRNATHRAMLACDMIVIFQDQLMDLFQRRPHESAIIRTAVLKEHHRKERLRYLSLRLLINWLEGGSKNKVNKHQPTHAMKMEVSALRIQIAWSKYLDRVYNGADPQPKAVIETPPTVDGATSAAVAMQLKKLDKLDQLDRLYAKLEQLLERSAPRSTR